MNNYIGEFEDFENKELNELIEDQGKTLGLATWFTVNAVNILESGNWETVRDFIYDELVNWIDE